MIRYCLLLTIICISTCAMEQELPSKNLDLSIAEKEYSILLETKLVDFYNTKFGINFSRSIKNDPVIARMVIAMINRDFILENSSNKKHFEKLYNNPRTRLNASDLISVNTRIADEAARSILAERRSLAYIMTGSYNQPWPVRPDFDQELKQLRENLGLRTTRKMQNPRLVEILESKKATWKAKPQARPINSEPVYRRPYQDSRHRSYETSSRQTGSGRTANNDSNDCVVS